MQLRATDIVAVLDDLNLSRAHYLGYSMGGQMGFGLAKYAPERCHSLLIGGMHPYRWGQDMLDQRANDLKRGMAAYVATLEAPGESLDPDYKAHLLTSDAGALIASTLEYRDWSGMAEVLPTMTMPCLLFVSITSFTVLNLNGTAIKPQQISANMGFLFEQRVKYSTTHF